MIPASDNGHATVADCRVAVADPNALDRTTLLLVTHLLDEILNALELWQQAGDSDWSWVAEYWSRHVTPWIGVELPSFVRNAPDAAALHRALLAWQSALIDALPW